MHPSALTTAKAFFDTYTIGKKDGVVIDVGSQEINGSLRQHCPDNLKYIGVDFVPGKNVDVILDDPYKFPFEDESVDVVVCNACFEHCELFWVTFLEIMRILKPTGLFYLNAPSNGDFHRYPMDCWRFYPDSGHALVTWANRNALNPVLLESFVGKQVEHCWNDFVAVFLKDKSFAHLYPARIVDAKSDFTNGQVFGREGIINFKSMPEDQEKLFAIGQITSGKLKIK